MFLLLLGEFVADVNSLISGLGNDSKYTITRCEYIMRYFPKTFVKAYSLIEKAKKDKKLIWKGKKYEYYSSF